MTKKLQNKKGFTLTELIVVIVIIGILAAVLIPTLTGYITKANKSAAEQEAYPYYTAYTAWQVEEELAGKNDEQLLDSFQAYCVELELVAEEDVENVVVAVSVAEDDMSFTIKSDKYFVTYSNGEWQEATETDPRV